MFTYMLMHKTSMIFWELQRSEPEPLVDRGNKQKLSGWIELTWRYQQEEVIISFGSSHHQISESR